MFHLNKQFSHYHCLCLLLFTHVNYSKCFVFQILNIEGAFISIFHLTLVTMIFCHWTACVHYLVAFLEGFPEYSWVNKCSLMVSLFQKLDFLNISLYTECYNETKAYLKLQCLLSCKFSQL